jgi:hypothetical protein
VNYDDYSPVYPVFNGVDSPYIQVKKFSLNAALTKRSQILERVAAPSDGRPG